MATFKKSAIISEISGTISGNTFLSAGTNSSIRSRSNRSGNRTASQSRYRSSFAAVASAWRNLAPASRLLWSSQASEELSGYGYFCRQNTRILWAGGTLIDNPRNSYPSINPVFLYTTFSNFRAECFIGFSFNNSTVVPSGWALVVRIGQTAVGFSRPTQADRFKTVFVYSPGVDMAALNIYDDIGASIGEISDTSKLHFQYTFVSLLSGNILPVTYFSVDAFNIDPDALAFINATGITDINTILAIDGLVVGLKGANIWNKFLAIYPFVGGTAFTNKFNLKNPADDNAAFRLSFSGGFTFSNFGIFPNGVNAFADTFLNGTHLVNNSTSYFIYSRTDSTNDNCDIGGANGVGSGLYALIKRNIGGAGFNSALYAGSQRLDFPPMPSSLGLIGASRINDSDHSSYRNGVLLATSNLTNTFDINSLTTDIVLCALRASPAGTPIEYSSRNLAACFIGEGLDSTEVQALHFINDAFQTLLGRNV